MSKSILKQLYDGDIFPAENILPKDPEYRILCEESAKLAEELEKNLTPEDKEIFEKIRNLDMQISHMQSFESFSYGFRLANTLMLDTFSVNQGTE